MKMNGLQRILAMVLFFSFIFVIPVCADDWSGIPDWNPGDGHDVIDSISVIESGCNLVVAHTESNSFHPEIAIYTMDDDGFKLSGPFIYDGAWTVKAKDAFSEYDAVAGKYVFNVFGKEYISYSVQQATFFRVYEDGSYVQNGSGENWHHFFNPAGEDFVDASSWYNVGKKLSNGNYLALGSIKMPNASNVSSNPLVVCFSSIGEVLWYRVLDGSEVAMVFDAVDNGIDFVECEGYIYLLIETASEGPGTEFGNYAYKIVKLDMDGGYINSETFGYEDNDYPKNIFVYNGSLIVCGYASVNSPYYKVFVNKISLGFSQVSEFPIIINEDNNNYFASDSVISGDIIHATGRAYIDVDREMRLFHMGIDLESKERTYLSFVGTGEGVDYIGRSVTVVEDGILTGGLCWEFGDDSDYFLSFLDLSSQTQTQEITLNAGWNLISTYLQPEDMDISVVLDSVLADCEKVWTFSAGVWYLYDPADPFFSDLSEIHAGQGYMIKMSSATTLPVSGSIVDEAISLSSGWEMPGYLSDITYSVEDALASILGKYDKVWTIEDGFWKLYDPADPFFSDLSEMKAGQGYMMKVDTSCDWLLPE